MVKPISPDEVTAKKLQTIPAEVIEVFNDLIARAWNGRVAIVSQAAAVERIERAMEINRSEIYSKGYLDIEPIYRAQGWKVVYMISLVSMKPMQRRLNFRGRRSHDLGAFAQDTLESAG